MDIRMKFVNIAAVMLIGNVVCVTGKQNISFNLANEWNLVPDKTGRLYMLHTSEINDESPGFDAQKNTLFILYTRDLSDSNSGQVIPLGSKDSLNLFNADYPTRIITHGWLNDRHSQLNVVVRDALLKNGQFNVFVVDWSAGSNTVSYITCRNRVDEMGALLAKFINFLIVDGDMRMETLVLIGHSLGAHISGIAGKIFRESRIPTIFGLDPAGPLFNEDAPNERLSRGDAEYIEVIHTSGATLGYTQPLGNADFYPNGGRSQPGCEFDLIGVCAHGRSFDYFAESLISDVGFVATPCFFPETEKGSCTRSGTATFMGVNSGKVESIGVYYLKTRPSSPFAVYI